MQKPKIQSMRKHLILIPVLAFMAKLNAQQLRLKNETINLSQEINTKDFMTLASSEKSSESVYRVISFSSLPTLEQLNNLKAEGIELLQYLPEKSYISRLSVNEHSYYLLKKNSCISVIPFSPRYKLERNLFQNYVPDYAKKGEKARFVIQYYKGVDAQALSSKLVSQGVQVIESNPSARTLTLWYNTWDFMDLALLQDVCFVQVVNPDPEKEDTPGRTLHRTQTLNSHNNQANASLPGIDGSGVSIGLADDGFVGPHIDFTGRITNYSTVVGQSHGDMTSGIAVGAGNLDPTMAGSAPGAYIHVFDIGGYPQINNSVNNMQTKGIFITSTSYSQGCNTYDVNSQQGDDLAHDNPNLLFVFSGGNNASGDCGYGAGAGWGNITGGYKQGKNVIAAANTDASDVIDATSSRGPASDGRLKPDIAANGKNQNSPNENNTYQVGGGTSAACPSIAGTCALMYQAYRNLNGGNNPEGALIKSTLMNTAHDIGNPGPDFIYGYGRINAMRAYNLLKDNRYLLDSVTQGQNKAHVLNVPAGTTKIKVMVYWLDEEGSPSAAKALVNDIDMTVTDPSATSFNPWVLDTTPTAANLSAAAVRAVDHLNNVEQVTIDNPAAGNYTVNVNGFLIPSGKQRYYLLWDYYDAGIKMTYPIGGECFVSGGSEILRWDNFSPNGNFILQYSTNGGSSWNNLSTGVTQTTKQLTWAVPNIQAANVLIKINNNGSADTTLPFTIIGRPSNITFPQACPDSITISWTGVTGATGYEVSRLGNEYMDSIAYSTGTSVKVPHMYLDTNWYSVRAIINGAKGRRANAVQKLPGLVNCVLADDAETNAIVYPGALLSTRCDSVDSIRVIAVYKNSGANSFSNISFSYKFGNLPTVTENYAGTINAGSSLTYTYNTFSNLTSLSGTVPFKVWISYGPDMNRYNDTILTNVTFTSVGTTPFMEDFQSGTFVPVGWSLATTFAGANWTANTSAVIGKSGAATICAEMDNYNLNQVASKQDLISKVVDLSGATNPMVYFDVAYVPYTGYYDSLEVRIANGCGGTFGPFVYKKGGVTLQTDPAGNLNAAFVPNAANQWRTDSASLASFTGGTVRVMFRNINRYGNFLYLDNINIKQSSASVGISNEAFTPRMFGLDPNPSSGMVHFTATNVKSKQIEIRAYSLEGKEMMNEKVICNGNEVSHFMDISKWAPGAYLFKIIFDDKPYNYKLIKN